MFNFVHNCAVTVRFKGDVLDKIITFNQVNATCTNNLLHFRNE